MVDLLKANNFLYSWRIGHNLCVACGKIAPEASKRRCKVCSIKLNRQQRDRRERKSLAIVDKLIDRNLLTTKEAADILGITREAVDGYIRKGLLPLKANRAIIGGDTYWVQEKDVKRLVTDHVPDMKCNKCSHLWKSKKPNPIRCPRNSCRSKDIVCIKTTSKSDWRKPIKFKRLKRNDILQMIADKKNNMSVRDLCAKYSVCPKTLYKYWNKREQFIT